MGNHGAVGVSGNTGVLVVLVVGSGDGLSLCAKLLMPVMICQLDPSEQALMKFLCNNKKKKKIIYI